MENNTWFGSVLIVTKGGGLYERPAPVLVIKACPANIGQQDNLSINRTGEEEQYGTVDGVDYSSFQVSEADGAKLNGSDNTPSTKGKRKCQPLVFFSCFARWKICCFEFLGFLLLHYSSLCDLASIENPALLVNC